jgi:predicted Fe-S protein YdhL (DUF1289 family)
VDWNRYDEAQKMAVMSRITQLMMDVVNRYLLVIDADQLRQSLESHGLRYRKDQPP